MQLGMETSFVHLLPFIILLKLLYLTTQGLTNPRLLAWFGLAIPQCTLLARLHACIYITLHIMLRYVTSLSI